MMSASFCDSGPLTRPFHDLLLRVPDLPGRPPRVVDLGCGDGEFTAVLADRWPDAHITGVDVSAQALGAAEKFAGETVGGGRVEFVRGDIADWTPQEPYDLVFSNAALQWVQGHADRFDDWTRTLAPGGVFAFQVPDNAASLSHVVLRDLCASQRWRNRLGEGTLHAFDVRSPADYMDRLAVLGFAVEAWETTYAHLLPGEDAFEAWIQGSGMRPVLAALGDDAEAAGEFLAAYRARLREAYPAKPHGTVFPFRRVFAVARKARAA